MSIAARVVTFSRSFRSLIKHARSWQRTIKDLKDLSVLRGCACYRHSGPTDLKRIRDVFSIARAMARDRPSPYDEGWLSAALLHRDQEGSPTRETESFPKKIHLK